MNRSNITKRIHSAWAWLKKPVAGIPPSGWMIAIVIGVLICWFWADIRFWMQGGGGKETNGETLRNFLLILAAPMGLWLAIWRSTTADTQADIAQRGLQNERYQKGADMLGSDTLSTRIGGIYALERLAQDHPEEYHIQIMDILCAFVRYPKAEKNTGDGGQNKKIRPDIQEAITVIGRRSQKQRDLEQKQQNLDKGIKWHLNLSKAHLGDARLKGAHLEHADLEGTRLERADLRNAHFEGADLRDTHFESATLWKSNFKDAFMLNTHLERADLKDAHLEGANLNAAHLDDANLRGAHLEGAKLEFASLKGARLKGAYLQDAILTGVELNGADLEDADLTNARMKFALLEGAKLGDTKGLTQSMLDSAKPSNHPHLKTKEGHQALCADFEVPLVWKWKSPTS